MDESVAAMIRAATEEREGLRADLARTRAAYAELRRRIADDERTHEWRHSDCCLSGHDRFDHASYRRALLEGLPDA